jgi:hypothetical protein
VFDLHFFTVQCADGVNLLGPKSKKEGTPNTWES